MKPKHLKTIALSILVASNVFAATNTLHDKTEKTSPSVNDETYIWDVTDSILKKSKTGSLPISTATQTALDGKETKAVVQASAPADTTVDWYDTDQESGVLILKRHNGTTWLRASSHGVQYLSNCLSIPAGFCVDTDDGKLYYHNNTSVVEVGTSSGSYTLPTASADTLGGVKVGSRLTITNGVLSADVQSGTGAVDSVNGVTGTVVLDADDISDTSTTKKFVTASEKTTWNAKQNALVAGTDYLTPTGSAAGLTGFPTLNQNTTGSAARLTTARTIGGVSFDGSANINLPGVNAAGNQSTTGNAATATTLQTARTIGGVSFNGSANINLPGVNTAGNQSTTGNAGTATALAANGINCSTGQAALGVDASGNAEGCWTPPGSFDPSSPGAIGGTTPAAGTFTTVTAANYTSSAADGSRRSILPSNTTMVPSGGGIVEIYNEGGAIKAVEANTEYDVLLSRDIGTSVQAYDADLAALAVPTAWRLYYSNGSSAQTGLAFGALNTFMVSGGASAAPSFYDMTTSINAGAPNGSSAKVHWSQLTGVPAGFADGSDDGTGGGITHATSDGTYYASRNGAWSAFTSGNYTLAMTLTGNTAITLPTAGTLVVSGGNIGAATATTPSVNDNDTSVATTAYVQAELTAYASDTATLTNKSVTAVEVDGSASGTLTAAQVSGTIVTNRGQAASDVALTMPTAAAGYNALFTVGTAQTNKWGVRAGTNDKIYLLAADGTISAGSDNGYARMTNAQVGQAFACWTFQTGSSTWDWQCKASAIGTSTFAAN